MVSHRFSGSILARNSLVAVSRITRISNLGCELSRVGGYIVTVDIPLRVISCRGTDDKLREES